MMTQSEVFMRLQLAREKADEKWGKESGSTIFAKGPYLGATVLMEEVGEVARAILEQDDENLRDELLDVMQVCCAWLEAL